MPSGTPGYSAAFALKIISASARILDGAGIEDVPAAESAFPDPADRVAPAPGDIGHVALEPDARNFSEGIEGGRAQRRAGDRFAEDVQEPFDRRAAPGRVGRRGIDRRAPAAAVFDRQAQRFGLGRKAGEPGQVGEFMAAPEGFGRVLLHRAPGAVAAHVVFAGVVGEGRRRARLFPAPLVGAGEEVDPAEGFPLARRPVGSRPDLLQGRNQRRHRALGAKLPVREIPRLRPSIQTLGRPGPRLRGGPPSSSCRGTGREPGGASTWVSDASAAVAAWRRSAAMAAWLRASSPRGA